MYKTNKKHKNTEYFYFLRHKQSQKTLFSLLFLFSRAHLALLDPLDHLAPQIAWEKHIFIIFLFFFIIIINNNK